MEATRPMGKFDRYTTMTRERRLEVARSVLDDPEPPIGTTTLAIALLLEAGERDALLAACQATLRILRTHDELERNLNDEGASAANLARLRNLLEGLGKSWREKIEAAIAKAEETPHDPA